MIDYTPSRLMDVMEAIEEDRLRSRLHQLVIINRGMAGGESAKELADEIISKLPDDA